jgi:CHAT domain-containing protein
LQDAGAFIDGNASRLNVLRGMSDARLIYFATHAHYQESAPAFSYLELWDGRLELRDVLDLDLHADLVVLSACRTGSGRLSGNESMGFVHGFLRAGAQNTIASNWSVEDRATHDLMTHFFSCYLDHGDPVRALALAQRSYLLHTKGILAHPYFWAGFAATGRGTNIAGPRISADPRLGRSIAGVN